jgi:uncharacterized protein YkwD
MRCSQGSTYVRTGSLFKQTRYNNPMVRRVIQRFIPLFLGLTIITLLMLKPVQAQSGSATELINAVNQLRQSLGLAPYSVDSYLMGFAQSHSDYMASIGRWTHTRADGTTSFDYGIKENVAMGSTLSVPYVVNTIWSDWVHWQTMVGYTTGKLEQVWLLRMASPITL